MNLNIVIGNGKTFLSVSYDYDLTDAFELYHHFFTCSDLVFSTVLFLLNKHLQSSLFSQVLTQQTFVLMKTSSSSSSEGALKTSSRRLDQDEYTHLSLRSSEDVLVKTNIFVLAIRLQDVFKTFSRCLPDVFKTFCQDIFKTFSRRLQDVLQKRLQDIFKTSSRRLQDVSKTSSRHLQDVLQRYLQDVSSS